MVVTSKGSPDKHPVSRFYRPTISQASGKSSAPPLLFGSHKDNSKRRKFMWYIVLSRSLPEMDTEKERNYEAHRQWLDEQHRAGRLLFSGPTTDGAYGIYVMLASSLEEAKAVAAQDPHHLEGIREMEVREWRAHRAFRLNGPTIEELEKMAKTGSPRQ
jgi:uncharacterized protein YciI